MTTIFEKIIAREIPADIIYEDDRVVVFLDIKPINIGHALVVPKVPFRNIFDSDDAILAHMMHVGALVGRQLKERLGAHGINLIMNNETAAGQEVFHAHLHVIPRYEHDDVLPHPKRTEVTPDELHETAEKLR